MGIKPLAHYLRRAQPLYVGGTLPTVAHYHSFFMGKSLPHAAEDEVDWRREREPKRQEVAGCKT